VDFIPARIDAALVSLGSKPWAADRPRVAMLLKVHLGDNAYVLASDGTFGRDQRESLADASWQMGVPIALPSEAMLSAAAITSAKVDSGDLRKIAKTANGDLPLSGDLTWDKHTLGWAAHWRLGFAGKNYRWEIHNVNFDDAFRSAMRGAAQILSGNGAP